MMEKKAFSTINNPDSMFSRGGMKNAVSYKHDDDNDFSNRQRSGKEIERMLDFDKEEKRSLIDKDPINSMDLVLQIWDAEEEENKKEEGDD